MKVGGKLPPFGGLFFWGAVGLLGACAAEAPMPTPHDPDLRVSEEVFRMFCMRIVRDEHPTDPDGVAYEPACQGKGAAPASSPRLDALLSRRPELIGALDQVFAESSGAQVPKVSAFQTDELTQFLASLIPFYDDQTMPKSTRALAGVAAKLLDPADERAKKVLDTFARLSPRTGYRASGDTLAGVRPMLGYPRLDQLSQQLLSFVGEGGPAHDVFLEVLRAAALELAEPAEAIADADLPESTSRLAGELLLRTPDDAYASASDPKKYFLLRDASGNAQPNMPGVSPFARYGVTDGVPRDAFGRAVTAPMGSTTVHQYLDANRTLLAALMRDQKPLIERTDPAKPSAVENLLRGVRPLLGTSMPRKEMFKLRIGDAGKPDTEGAFSFQGLDVEHSPLLDLMHALTQLARYPETDRMLALLYALLDTNENAAAAPVYAGLQIDKRADNPKHDKAQIVGFDGKAGSAHEFWDDVIAVGMRMAQRKGLFHDAAAALATPQGAAQARLVARFMRFKDEIPYVGAPLNIGADGKYSQADADKMNTPVTHDLSAEVVRADGADVGMNRSLFQRLISTIDATNGAPNCNKEGAVITANDPTTGTLLVFPNPTARPAQCNGDLICDGAAATAYSTIDLLCPASPPAQTFKRCDFTKQPNGAEMHMRAMLGRSEVKLKDKQLNCLNDAGLAGDLGATQEKSSQVKGFTMKPTAESIARFVYAPRNKWVKDLFDPLPTIHGAPIIDHEPNMLMALEVKDSAVTIDGKPQSFLDTAKALVGAFDDHETFEDTPDGKVAKGGYLFADLLGMLQHHWPSRNGSDCPRSDSDPACMGMGLSGKACNAGCSQSLDPAKPFYSRQSNLVSYEPLLIEALDDERFGDLLAMSSRALADIKINCEDGVSRDGLTILGDFLERVLTPDDKLASYGGKRKYAKTNTCFDERADASGNMVCSCPPGSQPVDPADATSACKLASGNIVPRGKVLGQTTPLHLVLDALRRFDDTFVDATWKDRLAPWRAARSALVDQFLTITKTPDAGDPMDAVKAKYTMANPRSRKVGMALIDYARKRIAHYRDLNAQNDDDLVAWANKLPDRLASVLAHPLVARGLDLYEKLWANNGAGGPADEMARFNAYLLDPAQQDVFAGVVLAAADTLEMADKDRSITPAIQFAALTLAENAFSALDSLQTGAPEAPKTDAGTAATGLEVTRKVANLNVGKPTVSALTRILRNAVLPNPGKLNRAPLETLIDAVADVNRADPSAPTTTPHSAADARAVFEQLRSFLVDKERGLERLYSVIGSRKVQ